jgi:hypothetical protein
MRRARSPRKSFVSVATGDSSCTQRRSRQNMAVNARVVVIVILDVDQRSPHVVAVVATKITRHDATRMPGASRPVEATYSS